MALATTILLLLLLPAATYAATFNITNLCPYTVWAAAVPGGGQQLEQGQTWFVNVDHGTANGRVWARTNCSFDATGLGYCQTGDCEGRLACQGPGSPPHTLAEYSLTQFKNLDWFDMSLVEGFNVPMEFGPDVGECHVVRCSADVNAECPEALRAPGGCNNPCPLYGTDEFCCTAAGGSNCTATELSMFFKRLCPDAYSYPRDDATSLFTCAAVSSYRVVFCPAPPPPT